MPRRRDLLLAAAGGALAGRGFAAPSADVALTSALSRHMDEYLAMSPQAAASLLTDARGRAARGRLDDRSPSGRAAGVAAAQRWRADLRRIDRGGLSPAMQTDYDRAAFAYEMLDEVGRRYGFQDHALRPGPYLVSQMTGAYYWQPQEFDREPIRTREDADLYLARLADFGRVLDGESEGIRADAAAGVVPPDFVLARTIGQLTSLRDTAAASLIDGPSGRALAAGLSDVPSMARKVLDQHVLPALTRQIGTLEALRPKAGSDGGVWRQPDGEAWYALGLRSNTTIRMPPEEMRALGLDVFRDLQAELDSLLKAQGLTQGSVARRIAQLDLDPRFLKPDTDAGRAEILRAGRDPAGGPRAPGAPARPAPACFPHPAGSRHHGGSDSRRDRGRRARRLL